MTQQPSQKQLIPRWVWLFLAGPVVWYGYFWVAYLAAEAGCTAEVADLVTWTTIALTGAALAVIGHYTWRAIRTQQAKDGQDSGGSLIRAGSLMGVIFVVATVFVGLPVLVLQPC